MLVDVIFLGTSLLVVVESIALLRADYGRNIIRIFNKKLAKSNRNNGNGHRSCSNNAGKARCSKAVL